MLLLIILVGVSCPKMTNKKGLFLVSGLMVRRLAEGVDIAVGTSHVSNSRAVLGKLGLK